MTMTSKQVHDEATAEAEGIATIQSDDEEEVNDVVGSLEAATGTSTVTHLRRRTKATSDISHMILRDAPHNSRMIPFNADGFETNLTPKEQEILQDEILYATSSSPSRAVGTRRKTKSDIAGLMARGLVLGCSGEGGIGRPHRTPRMRQGSSADVITKFGYAPQLGYEDLRYTEAIVQHGTPREREASNISDMIIKEIIEKPSKELFTKESFPFNHVGLTSSEATLRLRQYGKNELPEKITPKWKLFVMQFYAPMPIMIWIAILVEIAIQNWIDMGILLLIQFTNASISFYELNKAGNAVSALKSSLKPLATCKRDEKWIVVDATLLVPGDLVLLASGSAIPADCRVNASEIDVDQAALTGESLPVTFYKGDSCKMGSTVVRGEVNATVEFTGSDTFFGKTASLLQQSDEHSHLQKMLMRIMFVLVGLSVTLCLISFIYLVVDGESAKESLSFTIVLLVASIPLAIEIVTNATLAIGSKSLSRHGAIVARLSAIEDLAGMKILCSDKTGTLTLNKMVLEEETPVYHPGEDQESVLVYGALAAKWHEPPRDALDRLILGSVNMNSLEDYEQLEYLPFDPTSKRTEGTLRNKTTGDIFKTTKGAPHIILSLLSDSKTDVKAAVEADIVRYGNMGIRTLAVAKMDMANECNEWQIIGLLAFLDPPRPDTKQTILDANKYGVNVKMITGDHLLIAKQTANALAMGDMIFGPENLPMLDPVTKKKPDKLGETYGNLCLAADGFAQVFPEHKYLIVETLRELGYSVGMTGDGVNDAPALKVADVGIAVAGATDAARAAADIILTEEGLSTIIHGIVIAREIFSRISNFVTYRISATLQLLLFFFIALFAFHPSDYQPTDTDDEWPDYFHMPVLMLMLITLINDGTLITIAYDYAEASPTPNKWNLPVLWIASSTLGMVACFSSLLVLFFLLDSHNPSGLFQKLGMSGVEYGEITTAIYLKVSLSDFLTLFTARTGPKHFWKGARPAPVLLIGGVTALTISSMLAIFWPTTEPDGILTEGLRSNMGVFVFIWLYCLFFWIIQDVAKVYVYRFIYHVNFNGFGIVSSPTPIDIVGTVEDHD